MMKAETRLQWEGSSWRLLVYGHELPDGEIQEKGYIDHPGAVVLLPLDRQGQLLMLRQYRASLDETILELPAGTREQQESWLACAQRELREETGYRAETFTSLGEMWPAPGYSNELLAIYLASDLSADPLPADSDESIELQPMALQEALAMARDGRLRDAKSIVGILRLAAHMQDGG